MNLVTKVKETAKTWIALVSLILIAVADKVPAEWSGWVQLAIAIAGAIAVWATPNAISETTIAKAQAIITQRQADVPAEAPGDEGPAVG